MGRKIIALYCFIISVLSCASQRLSVISTETERLIEEGWTNQYQTPGLMTKSSDLVTDLRELLLTPNTKYIIRDNFDLKGTSINLPDNSMLVFEGGSISNGKLIGNRSVIISEFVAFHNVVLEGTWNCIGQAHWFAVPSEVSVAQNLRVQTKIDVTKALQNALDSSFPELHFRPGYYYVSSPLYLRKYKDITMDSGSATQYLFQAQSANVNKTVIFTDRDISLLKVQIDESLDFSKNVKITGGNFDVSLVGPRKYNSNCIEIDITKNRKLWGIDINTAIWGTYASYGSSPTGTGIKFITDPDSRGYATMIRVDSEISWFNTGVEIISNGKNWITDVVIDGVITNCATALRTGTDLYFDASAQPTYFFREKDNNCPVIDVLGGYCVIRGMIWDCGNSVTINGNEYFSNSIALHIGESVQGISLEGKPREIYKWHSKRVTGAVGKLRPVDVSYGDVSNYTPNTEFNYLEAFLNRGGKCTIQLLASGGARSSTTYSVKDIENIFCVNNGSCKIEFSDGHPQEGEYLELVISNIKEPIVYLALTSFVQYINGQYTTNFGTCEIEMNLSGGNKVTQTFDIKDATYSKLISCDLYNPTQYVCDSIVFRFKNITGNILLNKIIANKLKTVSQPYSIATCLPISGGKVYNSTDFEKLSIGGVPVSVSDDKMFIDDSYSLTFKSKRIYGSGVNSLFQIKSNSNPVLEPHTVVISSVYGISACKSAIYQFNVVGFTGNTRLEIKKLEGNVDFDFTVYKNADSNADYIVCLNSASLQSYGYVVSKLNNASSTAFEFSDISIAEIQQSGYKLYQPIQIKESGPSKERPDPAYISKGFQYYDEDLGMPIWYTGSGWVDALGKYVN